MSSFTSTSDDSDDIFYSFDEDHFEHATLVDEALEAQFNPGKNNINADTSSSSYSPQTNSCPTSPTLGPLCDALELKAIDPLLLLLQKKMSTEELRGSTGICALGEDPVSTDEDEGDPEYLESSVSNTYGEEEKISPSEKGKFKALFDKVKLKAEDIQTKAKTKADELHTMVKSIAVPKDRVKDKPDNMR